MKSVLLIGIGSFGKQIVYQLNRLGHEIMAIDKEEEKLQEILPYVTNAQIGDSTNYEFLRSLGVGNFDVCIVTIGDDFQNSLETTWSLKELGAKLVVSRASTEVQEKFLLRNGADEVMYPEKQIAKWAAIRYGSDHVLDYVELDDHTGIYEVRVPKQWVGKSVAQLDIRRKYHVNILAVKNNGDMNMVITPDMVLKQENTMLVLGTYQDMKKCFKNAL